jgi:hypothetical protein
MVRDEKSGDPLNRLDLRDADARRGAYRVRDGHAFASLVRDMARLPILSTQADRLRAETPEQLERVRGATDESVAGGWVNFNIRAYKELGGLEPLPRGALFNLSHRLGCSPATIKRWIRGRATWIQERCLRNLVLAANPYQLRALQRCISPPGGTEASRFEGLVHDVVGHCETEFEPLRHALGPSPEVHEVNEAVGRIVEPLSESALGRRIQFRPTAQDIDALRRFVVAGVDREVILLAYENSATERTLLSE